MDEQVRNYIVRTIFDKSDNFNDFIMYYNSFEQFLKDNKIQSLRISSKSL